MGHVQAAWLLSVDRQEVQSLQDNAWNLAIAQQLPQLLLCALRHLAASVAASTVAADTTASAKTTVVFVTTFLAATAVPAASERRRLLHQRLR